MKTNKSYKERIKNFNPTRERIHEIIFEAETKEGKLFDIILFIAILLSVLAVALETVPTYSKVYTTIFLVAEWFFTIFFTVEYILRLYCVYRPKKYATSFYGIVDLLSILPSYLSLILPGHLQSLMIIRALRLLRVMRIFKLAGLSSQGNFIVKALNQSKEKIAVFLFFIVIAISIFGSVMYVIEGGSNEAFDSIPRSIYWAIVTLTTVGYGDIVPTTVLGQIVAGMIMILGYSVIAVPTGIVSAEMVTESKREEEIYNEACRYCSKEGHSSEAIHCMFCGELLHPTVDEINQHGE